MQILVYINMQCKASTKASPKILSVFARTRRKEKVCRDPAAFLQKIEANSLVVCSVRSSGGAFSFFGGLPKMRSDFVQGAEPIFEFLKRLVLIRGGDGRNSAHRESGNFIQEKIRKIWCGMDKDRASENHSEVYVEGLSNFRVVNVFLKNSEEKPRGVLGERLVKEPSRCIWMSVWAGMWKAWNLTMKP